jgi:Ca-activated chloride channel family protein
MFRFEASYILWFLLLIPICFAITWLYFKWKKAAINRAGDYAVFSRLFPTWSEKKEWIKSSLIIISFAFLLISWANPQWGNRKQKVQAKSSDVIIALDISQSMLAEDISPSRMEQSKRFLKELIKKLKGDRIGLIYFAGSAYLQMPITADYGAAMDLISAANPSQAGTQGTSISDAIELSSNVFGNDGPNQKALIILSDGENHESEAIEAARKARENGTFVFTLGIGTQEGAVVPFLNKGRKQFKKDKAGNQVRSALNVDLLRDVADAGGGKFYMVDQTLSALKKLDSDIDKIEKQEVEQRSFTDFNSYFQYFLFFSILLFVIEFLISNKKNKKESKSRLLDAELDNANIL